MEQTCKKSLIKGLDKFLYSNLYPLLVTIVGLVFYVLKQEVIGVVILVFIMLFVLVAHRDTMPSFYPFLLVCTLPLRMYGNAEVWLKLVPFAAVIVPALLFRFLYYRPKYTKGKLFLPYLGIAIAITLGGIFSISVRDYFNITTLYYVLGLGFGMLGIYILLNAHIGTAEREYDLPDYLTKTMLWLGGFLVFMILNYYLENFSQLIRGELKIYMQMKNNVSTSLLITMPFAFYYSKKFKYHTAMFMFGMLQYIAMFLSFSRSGIMCGTIMAAICIVYAIWINDKTDRKFMIACVFCVALVGLMGVVLHYSALMNTLEIRSGEARVGLYQYAIDNFKKFPIFGTGLGHMGDDFYHPKTGGMYWYHSSPFQVIASLGTVGIIAYIFQFLARMKLVGRKINIFTLCALFSYCGVQIMSFVNPGVFCPLPYAFNVVLIFVVVEKQLDTHNTKVKKLA